jgi:uncharacterized protein
MNSQLLISEDGEKTFAVVFDPGEEVLTGLETFANKANLTAARFTAIGALSDAVLGFFDLEKKEYHKTAVKEQVEVLMLAGNVASHKGKPKIHAHIVVGKRDGTAHGGHLLEAHVRPTLEVMFIEGPKILKRITNEAVGLALLQPNA